MYAASLIHLTPHEQLWNLIISSFFVFFFLNNYGEIIDIMYRILQSYSMYIQCLV